MSLLCRVAVPLGSCPPGGTAEVAYDGLIATMGMTSEWFYPYVSHGGANFDCQLFPNMTRYATLAGYNALPTNQAGPLMEAIANGPVAISVDASAWYGMCFACAVDY